MGKGTGVLQNVLLATDLQADSRGVLEVGGTIAAEVGTGVHLYHVVEEGDGVRGTARTALLEKRSAHARRALDVQAERLEAMGAAVASVARARGGPAHRKILERAERMGSGLIVLGSHTREGSGNRLGSTADRVLRASPVPCLIVRGEARVPCRRVAVLTDFSRTARDAVRLAIAWLPAFGESGHAPSVDLVHAGDAHLHALDPGVGGLLEAELDAERERIRKRADGSVEVSTRLLWGHPAEAVMDAADGGGYDLLVVGTHGRGPLVRALVGSVALALAQGAPCPVLVVPPAS